MSIWTRTYWLAVAERSLKTAAQALLLFVGADRFDWLAFDWSRAAAVAIGAIVVSVLTSLVSAPIGPAGSPSLVVDRDDTVHPDAA